jgi:hypothetical protein
MPLEWVINSKEKPVKCLGRFPGLLATIPILLMGVSLAQDSAKQDMKDAGHEAKQAAKDTGRATKKTAKKTGQAAKEGTHKAAHKTEEGAQKVEDKTKPE